MLTSIDHIVSLLSSTAIGTAVILLGFLRIPQKERWMQISQARWILIGSFTVLVISGLFKIDASRSVLLSNITLCVASYQALLFSYTASVMLTRVKYRWEALTVFLFITLVSCLLIFTKLFTPAFHPYVWYLAVIAYCVQLAIHTVVFRRQFRETAVELENYYDENIDYHLSPIKRFFYSALFIGILALITSLLDCNSWSYNSFVLIYTIYYIYVAMAVMNYCFDGDFFLVAAKNLAEGTSTHNISSPLPHIAPISEDAHDVTEPAYEALEKALDKWVKDREFTKGDVSTDEVAAHLHVTRQQLAAYFKTAHNTTFRSWRQQLRLEYAQSIIHDNPDMPLAHLHELVGFNDRSNFHNAFRKFTGATPQEYRDNMS